MKICEKCRQKYSDDVNNCPKCGSKLMTPEEFLDKFGVGGISGDNIFQLDAAPVGTFLQTGVAPVGTFVQADAAPVGEFASDLNLTRSYIDSVVDYSENNHECCQLDSRSPDTSQPKS